MTNEEYLETQQKLILLGGMVAELELGDFIAAINKAETVGPFLDPTLFIKAGDKLGEVKRLAEAANVFRREVLRQQAKEGE